MESLRCARARFCYAPPVFPSVHRLTSRVALCLVLALGALESGCRGGGKDAHAGSAPVVSYREALSALRATETDAIGAIAARTGDRYVGDSSLLGALRDVALPRYREYVAGLRKIPASTPELGAFHARLVELAERQLATLERFEGAITRGDGTAVLLVNQEHLKIRAATGKLLGDFDALVNPPALPGGSPGGPGQEAK